MLYFPAFIIYIWYQAFHLKNIIYRYIVRFVLGYLLISIFGVILYYLFSDLTLQSSTATRTDIIYIFTACAALCAPILFLITMNLWKEQYKTSLNKESIIDCIEQIEDLKSQFLKSYEFFLGIHHNFEKNKEILANAIKNNIDQVKIKEMIESHQNGLHEVMNELYEKRTYEVFIQKNLVFKKFRILNITLNDMFSDEREKIENISIDFCLTIHKAYDYYLSEKKIKVDDIEHLYVLLEKLAVLTDVELYEKFSNLLLLNKNPS